MAHAENLYISASINRHSHAADVSSSSVVAFASQRLIALWDTSVSVDSGVSVVLPGHHAEVNCVKYMKSLDAIISADQKGVLQIQTKRFDKWKVFVKHDAHSNAITALEAHGNTIATGSSDATVKIWKLTQGEKSKGSLDLVQTLDMKGKFPLDIQIAEFPGTSCLIMAIASTGRDVNIWTGSENQFVHSASLSGHEDWVRSLAFTRSKHSPAQLTLASGSQDGTIRLWTIDPITPTHSHTTADSDLLDVFEASLGDFAEGEEGGRQMSPKRHIIAIKSLDENRHHFALVFDALLVGHDAGITSLSWRPESKDARSPPALLSTSIDSSVIIWSPVSLSVAPGQESASLWINQQRFGDVGGQRLGGFVGGLWSNGGNEAFAWGWAGSWRRWRSHDRQDGLVEVWKEIGAITGHQGVVKSIAWAPSGDYILSTGLDQTTRIFGPHRQRDSTTRELWHELARPQVHGYDIIDAEFLSPLRFVSIADEKVARVFDAPRNFVSMVNSLGTARTALSLEARPAGANVPPLGLSNKAADDDEIQSNTFIDMSLTTRYPFESELSSATLWPEIEKIFGHGYELISVATSHSGKFVVTACKSTTAEHAVLRVYNTQTWQLVGEPLGGHALTVTRIAFSPDDTMILSVSRDRTWRLFRTSESGDGYVPLSMDKSHTRIIWDCAWTHEESQLMFATASRDKTVKIWQPADASLDQWSAVKTLKFKEAATAVGVSPLLGDGSRRMAVGLESGEIFIYSSKRSATHDWSLELTLDPLLSHADSVHRILWRPSEDPGKIQQLATCSEDGTIRVMTVHLEFH